MHVVLFQLRLPLLDKNIFLGEAQALVIGEKVQIERKV
jgi:hypothetical protein